MMSGLFLCALRRADSLLAALAASCCLWCRNAGVEPARAWCYLGRTA